MMEHLYSNDNDFNTVGGLVLDLLEHIPQSGESVQWKKISFEVMDGNTNQPAPQRPI